MPESILRVAAKYVGKQETDGRNDGPQIRAWKALLGPGVAGAKGIPWCAIFVAAVLMLRNGMTRRQLVAKLGFRPGKTFLESCDSWVSEILAHDENCRLKGRPDDCYVVTSPRAGDIGFIMERDASGRYSKTKAHHVFIVAAAPAGWLLETIEGNTVPGGAEGKLSREGDGVYERYRGVENMGEMYLFARFPSSLTGAVPAG